LPKPEPKAVPKAVPEFARRCLRMLSALAVCEPEGSFLVTPMFRLGWMFGDRLTWRLGG